MPATIDVRAKREAFKNGPKLWNAIVYAPQEVFDNDPALQRSLMRQGFLIKHADDRSVLWSLPPAATPPPLYLADLLAYKHKVKATVATRELVKTARGLSKPADDLGSFMAGGHVSPGRKPLVVQFGSGQFIANCDHDHEERCQYLAGAGWAPMPDKRLNDRIVARFGSRPYLTTDVILAANLHSLMAPRAAAAMTTMMKTVTANFHASKEKGAPEIFDVPAPDGLEYLGFQKSGIKAVLERDHSTIIADGMGLGKTIQGVGVINGRPDFTNVLITCQANMKYKWADELRRWLINQDLSIGVAEGDTLPTTDIVIINYDIAFRHREALRARVWDLMINDEGHNMANGEAKRTLAIYGDVISLDPEYPPMTIRKGGLIVPMTGTPKPNEVTDLWPMLTTTRPDIWGQGPEAYRAFQQRYQPPRPIRVKKRRGRHEYEVTVETRGPVLREMELQIRLRAAGMIRREAGVTPMPQKFRLPLRLPFRFSEEDRKALAEIDADIEALAHRVAIEGGRIREGETLPASAVIDIVTGIAPTSPHFSEGARVRANLGLLKAPYVARYLVQRISEDLDLEPADRRKIVVFAHHKAVISAMAEIIRADFPDGVVVYDGSVSSAKKKQKLVEQFQTDPDVRVFIMSKSGNSGITLIAANEMVMAEGDWDPTNLAQIEDRIWRIGQKRTCTIQYAYAPDSYDINIGNAVVKKMTTDERMLNSLVLDPYGRPKKNNGMAEMFEAMEKGGSEKETDAVVIEDSPQMRFDL